MATTGPNRRKRTSTTKSRPHPAAYAAPLPPERHTVRVRWLTGIADEDGTEEDITSDSDSPFWQAARHCGVGETVRWQAPGGVTLAAVIISR